jgi:hypothetical protein
MKHFDKIRDILSSLDLGRPEVTVALVNAYNIRIKEYNWSPNLPENSFHESMVNSFARRNRIDHGENKGYAIDVTTTLEAIRQHVTYNFIAIFMEACPNKEPRRTALYKDILAISRRLQHNYNSDKEEALSLVFDIYDYYWSVTRQFTLNDAVNKVHQKNIYHLLNILEQKHGRKENSNG